MSGLILLLCGICFALATENTHLHSKSHHHHHRHHHHHSDLQPSFAQHKLTQQEHETVAIGNTDLCYEVLAGAFMLSFPCKAAIGQIGQDLPPDTKLTSIGSSTSFVDNCQYEKCTSLGVLDCNNWLHVEIQGEISDGLRQGYVPEALVVLGSCDVPPASKLVSTLTLTSNTPQDYPPMLPVRGDGLCYWTTHYDTIELRDTPCGTVLTHVRPDKSMTPMYATQYASDCKARSRAEIPAQKQSFINNGGDPHDFEPALPYTLYWWIQVQYGTQVGWVASGKVMKRRCKDTPVATCTLTPNTPKRCYRARSQVAFMQSACGTVLVRTPVESIFVSVDGQPSQPCTSDTSKKNFHVTFNGQDGYIQDSGLTPFPCNGDGWLQTVGPYTVTKVDHTVDTDGTELSWQQNTPSKFLLHTIDGQWPNWGDYPSGTLDGSKFWPHFHLARDISGKIVVAQYFSMYSGCRALVSGSPNSNVAGVVQVEIGARGEVPFTENDKEITIAVRALYKAISDYTGIPICKDSRVNFYGDYGNASATNGVQRLNGATFAAVNGLVGHGNVYANWHWDPGMIDPWKLIL